jgi:hypothetical protein
MAVVQDGGLGYCTGQRASFRLCCQRSHSRSADDGGSCVEQRTLLRNW